MHLRRVACFVLGAWIFGSLLTGYFAVQEATTADRLLGAPHPDLAKIVNLLGHEKTRAVLAHHASEQIRQNIVFWERAQLFIGPILLLVLVFATHTSRAALAMCGAMIIFTVFMHFVLTPEINYISRGLDFTTGWSGNNKRLWVLRGTYTGLESLKIGIGCVLAGYLWMFRTRRIRGGDADLLEVEHTTEVSPR